MITLLDMDGVCCDFVGAALQLHDRPNLVIRTWDMEQEIGITLAEFWAKIDAAGVSFWADMPEFPWFWPLYDQLRKHGPVIFVSMPSESPHSLSGKLLWLQTRFGRGFHDYVMIFHKHLLARPDHILLDDNPNNCQNFIAAGGQASLFPATYNDQTHFVISGRPPLAFRRTGDTIEFNRRTALVGEPLYADNFQ